MLVLNIRKLGEEMQFELAPRSYVILPDSEGDGEFEAFLMDFMLSRALAILKRVVKGNKEQPGPTFKSDNQKEEDDPDESTRPRTHHESSQGSNAAGSKPQKNWKAAVAEASPVPVIRWEPRPTRPLDRNSVDTALKIAHRYVSQEVSIKIQPEEWFVLRDARLDCEVDSKDSELGASINSEQREAAAVALSALPPNCQLSLLLNNVWLLKPSLNGGGNGRGILLFDRLPEGSSVPDNDSVPSLLLAWQAAVGRRGAQGINDARHGCVLQKCVEEPHLVNRGVLMQHWPTGKAVDCQLNDEKATEGKPAEEAVPLPEPSWFKYNLRIWMLASLGLSPSCWLHNEGYIDLSGLEFTNKLIPGAHVTNQVRLLLSM
jgi:hypothetical protein